MSVAALAVLAVLPWLLARHQLSILTELLIFGAFAMFLLGAEVAWSKVLTFFGQPPSREELMAGMNLSFVRASTRGLALAGTMAFAVLAVLLLALRATYNEPFWRTAGTRIVRPGG